MCWMTNRIAILKIAKEDIPVFKILKKDMTSVYFNWQYSLNIPYRSKLDCLQTFFDSEGTLNVIERGIHSYDLKQVKLKLARSKEDTFPYIVFGIYSNYNDIKLDTFEVHDCAKIVGYIPQGSYYYLNEKGEYVSDTIVLTTVESILNEIF